MKHILEVNVLYTKDVKPYKDKKTGEEKKPDHKCLVIVEDNIIDEEGNVKPGTRELKSYVDRMDIQKGKQKFEVRVSAYMPDNQQRPLVSTKILKVVK